MRLNIGTNILLFLVSKFFLNGNTAKSELKHRNYIQIRYFCIKNACLYHLNALVLSVNAILFQQCACFFSLIASYCATNCVLLKFKCVGKSMRTQLVGDFNALKFHADALKFHLLEKQKKNSASRIIIDAQCVRRNYKID